MRTITATIAALGFVGAVLAANAASAQVAFDRTDAYANTNTYSGHNGSIAGAYARASVSGRHHVRPVRAGARN